MILAKDILLAALRDMGADGVVEIGGTPITTRALRLCEIESGAWWPLPSARPAFRDDDGSLVPLPEGWMVNDDGCLIYREKGRTVVVLTFCPARRPVWRAAADRCVIGHFPTAPAAWRAAEAWITEQRAPEARKEDK